MSFRKNLLFYIFLIISIIFISGKSKDREKKAQFVGNYFFLPYTASLTYVNSYKELVEKVFNLEEKIFKLQSTNRNLKATLNRSQEIQNLFATKPLKKNKVIDIAAIIGTGSFFYYQTLMINVGKKNQRIKKDLPVVAFNGLVGKLISVYPTYSVVQTIHNKYFRAGARSIRGRVNGVLETNLHGDLYFHRIKIGSNIDVGDTISTSRLSTIYPPEIPVGEIINIEKTTNNMFLKAKVKPFVDIATTEEVAILSRRD